MKHLKLTALILMLVLLLEAVTLGASALGEKEANGEEKLGILFSSAEISVLSALDIINADELLKEAENTMTRKALAKLAVNLRGFADLAKANEGKQYFYDVKAEDENAVYISAAAASGLVKGKESGYFVPDAEVTKADAARTIINVLGYDAYLKAKGDSDENVIALAAEKGILKGVNATDSVTVLDILTMVKNSLELDVLYESAVGEDVEYSKDKDKNLLAMYHKVYEGEGIVSANSNTGLEYIKDKSPKGKIKIENSLFNLAETDYSELLGHNVSFYYQKKEDNAEATLLFAEDKKTEVLALTSDEISDFRNMKYYYFDEDDEIETAEAKGAMVIYNDTAVELKSFGFIPENGDVSLVDNDGDGDYEVILINDYTDSVVSSTDLGKNIVYFKTMPAIDLDTEENARIINASNNATLDVKGFRAGSVVSMAKGTNGNVTKMIVDFNYLTGKITQIAEDDGTTYFVDGIPYKAASSFDELVENKKAEKITVGTVGRFYLNHLGKIVYWDMSNTDYISGSNGWEYVIFNGLEEEKIFSDSFRAQFYTVSNQFEVFTLKEPIVIDGKTVADKAEVFKAFCCDGENGTQKDTPVKQVMRIKRNLKNEVTEIDRVGDENSGGAYIYNGVKNKELSWYRYGFCFGASTEFGSLVGSNTPIITCPTDQSGNLDTSDPKKMGYGTSIGLVHQTTYNVTIYKTDKDQVTADMCMVGENSTVELSYSDMFYVLLEIKTALNDDGEEQLKLVYSNADGEILENFVDSDFVDIKKIPLDSSLTGTYELKVGDAFRRHLFGNEITYIQPIFDNVNRVLANDAAENETAQLMGSYMMSTSAWVKYGYVKKIENDMVLCGYGNPGDGGEEFSFVINTTYATVLEYDREKNTLTKGTISQITDYASSGEDCTHFLINLREGHVTYQFIIYK